MEMNSENRHTPLPDMEQELKRIRRTLRRRSWKIVLTSLLCAAAILIASVKFAIPALEMQYWDPNTCTYIEGIPDLKIAMDVYTELFCPGYLIDSMEISKIGFSQYSINVCFQKVKDFTHFLWYSRDYYNSATIKKNTLSIPWNFWEYEFDDQFISAKGIMASEEHSKVILEQLPPYTHILAYAYFPENMDMKELTRFVYNNSVFTTEEAAFVWLSLANDNSKLSFGFNLSEFLHYNDDYLTWQGSINGSNVYQQPIFDEASEYPHLFLTRYAHTSEELEKHIFSMLKFSQDQLEKGVGIIPYDNSEPDFYKDTLAYFEENGIKSPGGYIIATPQALLQLLDEGAIKSVNIANAWISFS